MEYENAQTGYLGFIVLAWMMFIGGLVVTLAGEDQGEAALAMGISSLVIMVIVFWFNRLKVRVNGERVRVSFGPGWPRQTFKTHEIIGFRQIRNKWYYGWGVRRAPSGWMYNVWGLDAVELDLANGKKFIIGTNEPTELLAALSAHTALRPS
ncbi:MAG: hypothetical protein GY722_03605 [bacterium]|nr:hypothetical protein [bacterium]